MEGHANDAATSATIGQALGNFKIIAETLDPDGVAGLSWINSYQAYWGHHFVNSLERLVTMSQSLPAHKHDDPVAAEAECNNVILSLDDLAGEYVAFEEAAERVFGKLVSDARFVEDEQRARRREGFCAFCNCDDRVYFSDENDEYCQFHLEQGKEEDEEDEW